MSALLQLLEWVQMQKGTSCQQDLNEWVCLGKLYKPAQCFMLHSSKPALFATLESFSSSSRVHAEGFYFSSLQGFFIVWWLLVTLFLNPFLFPDAPGNV